MFSILLIVVGYIISLVGIIYGIVGLKDSSYPCKYDPKAFFKNYKITPPVNLIIEGVFALIAVSFFLVFYLKRIGSI
jgi:hypothetical protein